MTLPLPETGGAEAQPAQLEDRSAPRFTLLIRPAKLHVGAAQFVCVIRDISATGVSIRQFHEIAWHGPIALELQTGDRYPVEPVWQREGEAGFRFFEAIRVADVISGCSAYPKRDLRFEITWPIAIKSLGVSHGAKVVNLSRQGALIECDDLLAIGQAVMLQARGLPTIEARIRWRKGNRYGMVFDTTFSLQQLAVAIEQLQRSAPALIPASIRIANGAGQRN